MNLTLLRQVTILSAFIGAVFGVITLIPFVGNLTFLIIMCLASAIVIGIMWKYDLIEKLPIKDSIIIGAVIGFVSFIAFTIIYMPCVAILVNLFKLYSIYGVSLILTAGNFAFIAILAFFVAILSATVNAFGAFVTFYVIDFLESLKHNEQSEFQNNYIHQNYINDDKDDFRL